MTCTAARLHSAETMINKITALHRGYFRKLQFTAMGQVDLKSLLVPFRRLSFELRPKNTQFLETTVLPTDLYGTNVRKHQGGTDRREQAKKRQDAYVKKTKKMLQIIQNRSRAHKTRPGRATMAVADDQDYVGTKERCE